MRIIENRGEVDRRYDLDAGFVVITEEQLVVYRWNDDQPRVYRFETHVPLTQGELEYLRAKETGAQ